ncbi:MAG: MFS transporter [Coxiella sp. (in: Bacteria)]|nr:MAG: MFS transporter [Coxiella sp. (in: g-proteobacteria)]
MNAPSHTLDKKSKYYLFVAFVAAFAGILFGYDTGVISESLPFLVQQFHLTPFTKGVTVSAVLAGALVGAIFSGRLADKYGRKNMLIIDSVIFAVGTLASTLSYGLTTFCISRVVVGIAIGISSYIGPLYISEISPVKYRGALVSLNQLAISIGIFISYLIGYAFAAHGAWRWMFGIGIIPAILLLFGMIILPYSPRWMMAQGLEQKALAILNKIHGRTQAIQNEFELIKSSLKQEKGSWKMLFSKMIRPTLLIGSGLAFLQQVTGINTILYYATTIFTMAGFHSIHSAIFANIIVGGVFVIFSIVALAFIDTIGRRPLLFIGLSVMSVSLLGMSYAFHLPVGTKIIPYISLTSMLFFVAGFAVSLGPIMWLMISEIFPLKVRGRGSSLSTCVNWGSNLLVALTLPLLFAHIGRSNTFMIYFFISLGSLAFVYFFVPETKGISLEKIEENVYAGKAPRFIGDH